MKNVVISLTSYPKRIHMVHKVIESLWKQAVCANEILLYLSLNEFPQMEEDIPPVLKGMIGKNGFDIVWVEDNLKSHKKYYYALQQKKNSVVITVDDDVIYSESLIRDLLSVHSIFPQAVLARRGRIILREGDQLAEYQYWDGRCSQEYMESPRMDLCAIGIGGILYPPGCATENWFEKQVIKSEFENQDDLWLKYHEILDHIPVVYVRSQVKDQYLEEARDTSLWKKNQYENDIKIKRLFNLLKKEYDDVYREWFFSLIEKDDYILEKKTCYSKCIEEKIDAMGTVPIYIFGAGKRAEMIINILDDFNILYRLEGILVSHKSGNPNRLKTLEIKQLDELDKSKEFAVIYGVGPAYKKEIDATLNDYNCKSYDLDIDTISWCYL